MDQIAEQMRDSEKTLLQNMQRKLTDIKIPSQTENKTDECQRCGADKHLLLSISGKLRQAKIISKIIEIIEM